MPFDGMKVLSLESRRSTEMAELIRRQGGHPFVAPSMRELPLESNQEAFQFADRLFAGGFDMMILMTGVGTRALNRVLASRYPAEAFAEALRRMTVVARGPKPIGALREMNVPATVSVPEPNTWREVLAAIESRPERHIAVQEYGRSNPEMLDALRAGGAEVTPVRVYQYDLPEDTGPLTEAVSRLSGGDFDAVLFTTANQAANLMRIAADLGLEAEMRQAVRRTMVASIGPTTTEMLEELEIPPDMMPSHAKMGFLVKEAAEQAENILRRKRA
jgi:uroporphyrinogen-III synthase